MRTFRESSRGRFVFLTAAIWLTSTCLILATPLSGIAQTLLSYKADPVYGGMGFVRAHWATSINKMLVFLVPGKETSVRAFDPTTNTWEFLWPSNTLGIQGRDNFASFYIPRLDELWVWDGSYLWDNPNSLYSGRFNVSQRKWVATGKTDTDAFVGVVDMSATGGNMPFSGTDPAMAWAANSDMGLMLGGSSESGEYTYLFEPKPDGPERYKVTRLTIPRPPWRAQCMNCMVSDGKDFYLMGGMYQEPNDSTRRNRKDLWKFDTSTRTWIQLPAPPDVAYSPTLTYDSDRNALVSWVRNKLYVYNISTQQWSDLTPPGLPCVFNQLGAYSPTAKAHVYEGGNDCNSASGDDGFYSVVGITLSGASQPVATSTTSTASTQSSSTITSSGTFTVTPAPSPSTKFQIGNRVAVTATATSIRSNPSSSSSAVGSQNINALGTVNGGPTFADNFWWWQIDYDTGTDGWSAEDFLSKSATTPTVAQALTLSASTSPTPTPTPQQPGCESEGGLLGRTDILKCEGWELSTWYSDGGWWEDQGDTGATLDGRRFHRHPLQASDMGSAAIATTGCISGNCLQINMLKWNHTPGGGWLGANWSIPGIGGCAHETLGCIPQQEVWIRYYLKLSSNFDPEGYSVIDGSPSSGGGKFPGLSDAINGEAAYPGDIQCGNGGEGPTNGTECWSLRSTFQPCSVTANGTHNVCLEDGNASASTRFGLYPYLYNNGIVGGTRSSVTFMDSDGRGSMDGPCTDTYGFGGNNIGPGCGSGLPGLLNGRWYLYEMHVKMNDAGSFNGVIETWIDDVLRYRKTNVNFRNIGHNNIGVRNFWLDIFTGGTGVGMKEDMQVWFDQMVIATGGRVGALNMSSVTPPPPQPPVAIALQPASTLKAMNLGVTGEDKVGQINQTTANGKADFHISVSGLRGTPNKVTITSDTGGIWETPFNGLNWIIATQYDGQGNGNYWFEQVTSKNFRVRVRYSDGTTDEADATNTTTSTTPLPVASTLTASFVGVDADKVGKTAVAQDGQADFRIRLSGLRSNPIKLAVTSDTGGIWNYPFDGSHWIVGTFNYSAGTADLYFAQWPSNKFHVQVWYADGTTDAADVENQTTPGVKFSQMNLIFDTQMVGSPQIVQPVVLTNSGLAGLNINGITSSGDFSQSSDCPSALAPGAQCVISVAFQPLVPGARNGTLTVTDNALGSPHVVNLSGTAIPVVIDTKPPTIIITSPTTMALLSKTVAVALSATDDSGVGKIELYKDGILIGTGTSNTFRYDWDTTKEANGNHTLIAMAYDLANNRATATITANVQNTTTTGVPPSVLGKRF